MKTNSIMQKGSATTVITSMEGPKGLGIAPMKSCMQVGCAKIAILIATIERKDWPEMMVLIKLTLTQI